MLRRSMMFKGAWAYLLLAVLLLSSCKGLKPTVEVPVYIHDTTETVRELHDSTFVERWHTEWLKGDTCFLHDSIYFFNIRTVHDTVREYKEKPVEIVKYVKKPFSRWQKSLIWVNGLSIAAMLIALIIRLRRR